MFTVSSDHRSAVDSIARTVRSYKGAPAFGDVFTVGISRVAGLKRFATVFQISAGNVSLIPSSAVGFPPVLRESAH